MPRPSTVIASPRPDLAAAFMEYNLDVSAAGYVALELFRPFSTPDQAGTFPKITLESLLQEAKTERAYGADYSRGNYEFTTDSFVTSEHGWEEVVDERSSRIYREFLDAEMVATLRAVNIILGNAERRMASLLFNASTFASQKTDIVHEWDDAVNAKPIDDVETGCRAFWSRTGFWPDTLTINMHVFRNLRLCDQVLDRISANGAGDKIKAVDITAEMLAQVFGLERVLVAGGAKNAANIGQARSIASIWSDEYAVLTTTAKTDDLSEPCTGRTFHWDEDGGDLFGSIESYEEARNRSTIIRCRHEIQEKLLYSEAVHLFTNVTT